MHFDVSSTKLRALGNHGFYLLALLDFQLAVYSYFSKQIVGTVQYNEKRNGIINILA